MAEQKHKQPTPYENNVDAQRQCQLVQKMNLNDFDHPEVKLLEVPARTFGIPYVLLKETILGIGK